MEVYSAVKAELNRAVTKAIDENNYDLTGQNLNVDFGPMLTKSRFTEGIRILFRRTTDSDNINVHYMGAGGNTNIATKIPVDDNLIFYSGSFSLAKGVYYEAGSNGLLTYKGIA